MTDRQDDHLDLILRSDYDLDHTEQYSNGTTVTVYFEKGVEGKGVVVITSVTADGTVININCLGEKTIDVDMEEMLYCELLKTVKMG